MALTNAERQARHRAKHKAPIIWDHQIGEDRPATQADVDLLLRYAGEAADLRHKLLAALGLPLNAHEQVARLGALGGIYGAPRPEAVKAWRKENALAAAGANKC